MLWSVSGGVQGLVKSLNLVYDERETRGFVKLRGLSLLLTLGAIVVVVVALALIAVFPGLIEDLGLGQAGELAASIARWVVLALVVLTALAVVYRYAPDRANPRWRWVSWGAVVALDGLAARLRRVQLVRRQLRRTTRPTAPWPR